MNMDAKIAMAALLMRRPEYQQALHRLLWRRGSGLTLLRITRNPTNRLVSIFRHACRFPFLREPARQILGFDINRRGLSLEDFDKVLGGLRLVPPSRANPHVLVQYTPLWDMAFDRVITLNLDEVSLDASLNAVERDLGLPVTDFASIAEFRRLRDEHYAIPCRYFGPGPIELRRFRRHETQPFPKHALTASPLLESMAQRHHALDWGRVATGDTAGALFQPAAGPRGPDPNSTLPATGRPPATGRRSSLTSNG